MRLALAHCATGVHSELACGAIGTVLLPGRLWSVKSGSALQNGNVLDGNVLIVGLALALEHLGKATGAQRRHKLVLLVHWLYTCAAALSCCAALSCRTMPLAHE